jgi:hypothetical protein
MCAVRRSISANTTIIPVVLLRASIGGGGQEWKSVPLPNGLKWEQVGKGGDGGYVAKK